MKNKYSVHTSFLHIITILFFVCGRYNCFSQSIEKKPVTDIFQVMNEVNNLSSLDLWPGFEIQKIPVAVYDSVNTYLFNSSQQPDGFIPLADKPDVLIYEGQHPSIRGNSVIRLNDVWIATSILSNYSRRTAEEYSIRDMAGIIIHEQFHIYQRTNHPDWRQNDGLLLIYPRETIESLFLRRIEKEAFKRAVTANDINEIANWANEGLKYRARRLSLIDSTFGLYEKVLQLTEGLSDYIEKTARGVDPLNSSSITNLIAPAGIREMGYIEGRWIAMILDKIKPDWKIVIEKGEVNYLEDILKSITRDYDLKEMFLKKEVDELRINAENDFSKWELDKKHLLDKFYNEPGYKIEINASSNPLNIRMFEPLEMEIYDNGNVLHKVFFSAANNESNLRILNNPCLTIFDRMLRIVKVIITGIKDVPQDNGTEKLLKINSDGLTINLKYSKITINEKNITLEL